MVNRDHIDLHGVDTGASRVSIFLMSNKTASYNDVTMYLLGLILDVSKECVHAFERQFLRALVCDLLQLRDRMVLEEFHFRMRGQLLRCCLQLVEPG